MITRNILTSSDFIDLIKGIGFKNITNKGGLKDYSIETYELSLNEYLSIDFSISTTNPIFDFNKSTIEIGKSLGESLYRLYITDDYKIPGISGTHIKQSEITNGWVELNSDLVRKIFRKVIRENTLCELIGF